MARRRHSGLVLTNAPTIDEVDEAIRRGGYDAVKYVTGWGLDTGWTPETIARAVGLAPQVIVRTRAGDPSLDRRFGGEFTFIDPTRTEVEIYPWYRCRRDIWVELGNEPNAYPVSGKEMYEYAYYLGETITRCERVFPDAKLIAPAMIMDRENAEQFMRICQLQMRRCHAIALHAYEWETFTGPASGRKGELEKALDLAGKLFPDKDWWLTEYGIHGPKLPATTKGARYAELLHRRALPEQLLGATYYHLAVGGTPRIQPEYHIAPRGELAYHQARYGTV